MAPDRETGAPATRLASAEDQDLWPLLYELNGTVARVDEGVQGLKERVSSVDRRMEGLSKDSHDMAKEISSAKGSITALKWVFGLLVPIVTVALTMIAKHFGYL